MKNVETVGTPDARLIVVESVIPETSGFDMGKWMDLNMMMMATGRERTAAEFRDLFERAGFARASRPHVFATQHRRGKASEPPRLISRVRCPRTSAMLVLASRGSLAAGPRHHQQVARCRRPRRSKRRTRR